MANYWCKTCKTFVVDTKLGRSEHERSAKHKNGIARSIREMHQMSAEEERQSKQAAEELRKIERELGGKTSVDRPDVAETRQLPYSEPERVVKKVTKVRTKRSNLLGDLGPGYGPEYDTQSQSTPSEIVPVPQAESKGDFGEERSTEANESTGSTGFTGKRTMDQDDNGAEGEDEDEKGEPKRTVLQAMMERRKKNQRVKDASENWNVTRQVEKAPPKVINFDGVENSNIKSEDIKQEPKEEPDSMASSAPSEEKKPAAPMFKKRKLGGNAKKVRNV
uniref:ARAD1C06776p n=1 Tax=Blastobotrys adeninivorans TaxID=409370 RepID=A0A060T5Q4_BLAAD